MKLKKRVGKRQRQEVEVKTTHKRMGSLGLSPVEYTSCPVLCLVIVSHAHGLGYFYSNPIARINVGDDSAKPQIS